MRLYLALRLLLFFGIPGALPACRQAPILATTANAFNEDRQRCLDAGMNDHIGKPVAPAVRFQTLLRWLDKTET